MTSKAHSILLAFLVICLSQEGDVRGQGEKDAPDTDLAKMMEMANQMQKETEAIEKQDSKTGVAKPKKSMAELQALAKEQAAQIEQSEKAQKQKLAVALKKQLDAPGPVALPDWTPKLPEMKPDGPAARKIIDEQVYTVVTGTSSLTPAQLGDAWEKEKTEKVSIGRSNNVFNDLKQVIIYVHPQGVFEQEVRLEAERREKERVTRVKISSPLPKPEVDGDE